MSFVSLCHLYFAHTCISHVVDLIKDDPRHFPHDLRASVQHTPQDLGENQFIMSDHPLWAASHSTCSALYKDHPQIKVIFDKPNNDSAFWDITLSYLCCHDEAGGGGVDGDITSHQSHILELLIHLSVLLVGEGLDGAGENHSLLLSEGQCNGIPARQINQVRSP